MCSNCDNMLQVPMAFEHKADLVTTKPLLAMELLAILLRISRILGLSNLRFVPGRRRLEQDNGPMIIYCIVMHIMYVLMIPLGFSTIVRTYYDCQKLDMVAMAYTVVSLTKSIAILFLLSSVWLLRTKWLRMVNGFLKFRDLYRRELEHSARVIVWRHLWKVVLTLSRYSLLFHLLFGPPSIFMCDKMEKVRAKFTPLYVGMSLGITLSEALITCCDYCVYYLINLSNRVLRIMALEAQGLHEDLRWLPQRRGCHRYVYQQQLLAGWNQLWRRCVRLDRLSRDMLHVIQWQILFNLLASYVTDIAVLFNFIVYSTETDKLDLPFFILYLMLFMLFHADIMNYFGVFGTNRWYWSHLLVHIEKFYFSLGNMEFDQISDTYCIAMQRQVSFAIMLINRRQHRQQNRVRRLHIAGLFDMNRRTAYNMTTSIAINVVILWQIAYRNYY